MKTILVSAFLFFSLFSITKLVAQEGTLDPYQQITYGADDVPLYFSHQIIVKFNPNILNTEIINDTSFREGELQSFFSQESLLLVEQSGFWNSMVAMAHTEKIYWYLTTNDTYSVSRLGDTIPLDNHWSSLLIYWPIDHELSILQVCDTLKQYFPFILEAQPNYIYLQVNVPNDPLYSSEQFSLFSNASYTDANINIEQAWEIETGKSYVKVGVYDNSISWGHEDFGNGTWLGSKIKGGWDFSTQQHISNVPHPPSVLKGNHGNQVAGIIGAIRDNEIGIAGIAGGEADNTGVELYSFGIFGKLGYTSDAYASSAIVQGSIQNPANGYGLHIQNHSWGGLLPSPELKSALNTAVLNQCILVCSRGNGGSTTLFYPASYNDDYVISVGASGTNGQHKTYSNGGGNWRSSYGGTMDIIAPGTEELIETTIDNTIPMTPDCSLNNGHYNCFEGTSAAAPHVAGVAALLYSRHNTQAGYGNNLAPEDVEELLQKYATDIVGGGNNYPIGPDPENGWGRINAGASLDVVKNHQYRVHHFGGQPNFFSFILTEKDQLISLSNTSMFGLADNDYIADLYTVNHSYSHTFSPSTQILGAWPRLSATNGLSSLANQNGDRFEDLVFTITGNTITVDITTFAWFIKTDPLNTINRWLTLPPSQMFTGYSVHTYDPLANSISENIVQDLIKCTIFPNPTTTLLNISVENDLIREVEIFDLIGNLVYSKSFQNLKSNKCEVQIGNLNSGIFVSRVLTKKGLYNAKFIKE